MFQMLSLPAMTLLETIQHCMPDASPYVHLFLEQTMKSRWWYVHSEAFRLSKNKRIINSRFNMTTVPTLPFEMAVNYVEQWKPWAVSMLKNEVDDIINGIDDFGSDKIAIGKCAKTIEMPDN